MRQKISCVCSERGWVCMPVRAGSVGEDEGRADI